MSNYVIFTDSACDITPEVLKEWGVRGVSLAFRFDHIDQDFKNEDMPIKEFYQNMRDGHVAKTNAVNAETFRENFEPVLAEGTDILYLGFSSGLSTTFQQGKLAAEDLAEKYPESYDAGVPEELVYSGGLKLTDAVEGSPIDAG